MHYISAKTLKKQLKKLVNPIRFRVKLARHAPVFIYQMGKVGSSSIYESLLEQYNGAVLHSHSFRPDHGNPEIKALYRWVMDGNRPLKVITLTREPVSRNVSAFFQTFERTIGVSCEKSEFSMKELKELFMLRGEHNVPLDWFDDNILENFGIDVYEKEIPQNGISHYMNKNVQVLLIRCETGDAYKEAAIRNFLSLPNFQLYRRNVSALKDYSDTYTKFVEQVKLPDEYIDRLCQSKYFRHFYGDETLNTVKKNWSDVR